MVCVCLILCVLPVLGFAFYKWLLPKWFVSNTDHKVVLITGCDSGLGHSSAINFVSKGVHVIAGCYTEDGQKKLQLACAANEDLLHTVQIDITSDASLANALTDVNDFLNKRRDMCLWAVVCNAGVERIDCPDDWTTIDDYREHMDVNFYGQIRTVHTFKPLIKQCCGRIIIVASIRSQVCIPEGAPYTCSKYALEGYANTLRQEMKYFGVSVHIVHPGGFKTNIQDTLDIAMEKRIASLPDDIKSEWGDEQCQMRLHAIRTTYREILANKTHDPIHQAYEQAAFSRYPLDRYWTGVDTWWYHLQSIVPDWLHDAMMRRMFEAVLPLPARSSNVGQKKST